MTFSKRPLFQRWCYLIRRSKKARQRLVIGTALCFLTVIATLVLCLSLPVQQNFEGVFLTKSLSFSYAKTAKRIKIFTGAINVNCIMMSGLENIPPKALTSAVPDLLLKEDSLLSIGQCGSSNLNSGGKDRLAVKELVLPSNTKITLFYNPNPENRSVSIDLELPEKSQALLSILVPNRTVPLEVENAILSRKLGNHSLPSIQGSKHLLIALKFSKSFIRLELEKGSEYQDDWLSSVEYIEQFQFRDTEQSLNGGKNSSQIVSGTMQLDGKEGSILIPEESDLAIEGGSIQELRSVKIDKDYDKDTKQTKEGLRVKLRGKATLIKVGSQKPVSVSRLDLLPDKVVSILVSAIVGTVFGSVAALITESIKKWVEQA